jgi:hypothetical protein
MKFETNQDAQAYSDFTKLLDYSLCCAVGSRCDNSVVSPSDIEDATHGLPDVESENCCLTYKVE